MGNLYVQETYLNQTEAYIFGESDVYETYTDNRGELFKAMQREYGRCTGKSYIDTEDGPHMIGWVFEKKCAYEDDPKKFYTREVWVTLHNAPPTKTIEYHYAS